MIFRFLVIATLVMVVFASDCHAQDVDIPRMESLEEELRLRQRNTLLARMRIEQMFADERVQALARAAARGKKRVVARLVAEGVDVNSEGAQGVVPLFCALRGSSLSGFEQLLALGADPDRRFGQSSLIHWAARHRDSRFLELLLEYGADPNLSAGHPPEPPLFKTIGVPGEGNRSSMLLLINAGADIDAVSGPFAIDGVPAGGQTPVMAAAEVMRFDTVYELLMLGAKFDQKDDFGNSLGDRVVHFQGFPSGSKQAKYWQDVVTWLKEHGVDLGL
ncbi:MAG: ankyrin repeat domain-containing protein [Pseudomonadota bacterium]